MASKRERVTNAIGRRGMGWVPWQIDLTRVLASRIQAQFGCSDAAVLLDNHLLNCKYREDRAIGNGLYEDLFGVRWKGGEEDGTIGVPFDFPIKDGRLTGYHFPEVRKDVAVSLARKLENDDSGRFRMFGLLLSYFERAWSLRGMENILIDMHSEPNGVRALLSRILQYNMELLETALSYEIDGIYLTDDWGTQKGMLMSPDMWREFIKPGVKEMFDLIKKKGKYSILHSCGNIIEVMPDLIEMGLDVYNSVQPEVYDLHVLKREFGRDITFYGGVSTQQLLTARSADEVYELSRRTIDVLNADGGYIFAPTHTITPDVPVENVLSMVRAVKNVNGGV